MTERASAGEHVPTAERVIGRFVVTINSKLTVPKEEACPCRSNGRVTEMASTGRCGREP